MTPTLHAHASGGGKVIVLGEHAVVHGFPALAAGLPQSLTLRATPLADRSASIHLHIPAWSLELDLRGDEDHPVARAALEVLGFCDGPVRGWAIHGETHLPAGAGLGSSAALTVALARLVLGPDAPLDDVVEASLAGERVFHGEPSGIDSYLAAQGGLIRFVRGERPEPVPLSAPVDLVIVPSGVPRSTAAQIDRVRQRHRALPRLVGPILQILGDSVTAGLESLSRHDLATFGTIMSMSHELLSALGVSSPVLDNLCAVALEHGAHGAKLTGAGGGGCMVALPAGDPDSLVETFRRRGQLPLRVVLQP